MEPEKEKKTIEVSDIIAVVIKRKWLITIPIIAISLIFYFGSYLITPEYESSVIIWLGNPVKLSDQLRRLMGDASNAFADDRQRLEQMRSLQNEVTSSSFIKLLSDRLKLDQDAALKKRAQELRASHPEIDINQAAFDLLVDDLRNRIQVGSAGWEQIKITVLSTNAVKARDIAQNLGEILMEEKTKEELGSVQMSQDFTHEQLAKYEKDLQDKIDERTDFERRYMGLQVNALVVSDTNRQAIVAEITTTDADIEDKKTDERQLLTKLSNIPSSKLVLNESSDLRRMKDDLRGLLVSIATLIPKYRWSDPEILNFKTKLYGYMTGMEDETKTLVDNQFSSYDKPTRALIAQLFSTRADLDMLYSKKNNLELALADLNDKIGSVPEYQARLDQLNREITAARDLRDRFKEQQEGSSISQAFLSESRFHIVEPARVPLVPVRPNRFKIVLVGVVLGLMAGAGLALASEFFDTSLRNVEQVQEYVGCRVIGVIPEISSLKNKAKAKRSG